MNAATGKFFCASCNVPLQVRGEPDDQNVGFCPQCGASDTLENIAREAIDHMMSKHAGDVSALVKDSPYLKITTNHDPERVYRFMMGGELGNG
jgi:predicted RNA-binding Zn-ribbon protein involved in translation (DUF1610 family)